VLIISDAEEFGVANLGQLIDDLAHIQEGTCTISYRACAVAAIARPELSIMHCGYSGKNLARTQYKIDKGEQPEP
jgi:hypothetical protein